MDERRASLGLVDLTLESVSNGALEGRFQELLGEVVGIMETADAYVSAADGTRTMRITAEIEIRHRPAIGGDPESVVIVSGAELKRPKRHKAAQAAHLEDGALVVLKREPEQVDAFPGQGAGGIVTPFAAASNGEETPSHE